MGDRYVEDTKSIICQECDGTGQDFSAFDGSYVGTCDHCEGEGTVEVPLTITEWKEKYLEALDIIYQCCKELDELKQADAGRKALGGE